jgi:small subunit ribosomal protein S16
MGSKKRPFYRIIATDSRMPRDGRFIETLGYYDPMRSPAIVNIKEDLVFKWMERGARPTDNTERILRNVGVMKKWSLLKQGVSRDELDTKYEELKANETPAMDRAEREEKRAAIAEAKAAEQAEATAEAPEAAAAPAKAAEEKPEAAAEPEPAPEAAAEPEAAPEAAAEPEPTPEAEAEAKPDAAADEKPEAEAGEVPDDDGDTEKKS